MSEEPDEIKRWTARRKATVVIDIIKGKTTAPDVARTHDLTVSEVEQWMDDFVSEPPPARSLSLPPAVRSRPARKAITCQ